MGAVVDLAKADLAAAPACFPKSPLMQPFPLQPEMVNVIIQGTIYIFNKPSQAILQTPGEQPAGEQPPAEQTTTTAATP